MNIVIKIFLIIDSLIKHQKIKKPSFFKCQGKCLYMWGYKFVNVTEFNKMYKKKIHINKIQSGSWYNFIKLKSKIVIFFGKKFCNLINCEYN